MHQLLLSHLFEGTKKRMPTSDEHPSFLNWQACHYAVVYFQSNIYDPTQNGGPNNYLKEYYSDRTYEGHRGTDFIDKINKVGNRCTCKNDSNAEEAIQT